MKRLVALFLIFLLLYFSSAQVTIAKADDLVIQDDGKVVLIITRDNVLGISATTKESAKTAASPPQAPSPAQTSPTPTKIIPLVPARTKSTVQINPPINSGNKVQVTITTGVPAQTPQITSPSTKLSPAATSPTLAVTTQAVPTTAKPTVNPAANVITKTVDQVVAQGPNGKPVITIKSGEARQLTIQQGPTEVKTSLPLEIDTLTHTLSVSSPSQPTKVNVLPKEVLQGIINKGLLSTQDASQAKINLARDENGVNYTVQSERKGKLFGLFEVKSPVEVKLSAQTGKVLKTSQSPIFSALGFFIK